MSPHENILGAGIEVMGLQIPAAQQKKLLVYLELLNKWNKVYNLTAIRELDRMVVHHILDSLAVAPYLWPQRWLDVGCGPGVPGLILAIIRPEWSFDLLDSNSKKTSFVQQAIIELSLKNARVHCERVETWYVAQGFDGIISRAFTELPKLISVTRHLLAEGGGWLAMKGEIGKDSVPEQIMLEKTVRIRVPGLSAARSLMILREKHGQNTRHH